MNTKQCLLATMSLLFLSGCVSPTSLASSSEFISGTSDGQSTSESSETVSAVSSSGFSSHSSEDSLSFYLNHLSKETIYTSVRRTLSVSKGDVIYKNSYDYRVYDANDVIEHAFGAESVMAGLENNDDKSTSSYDIYRTPELVYSKGYDGKYQVSVAPDALQLGPYTLPYDFSYATSFSLSYVSFDAIMTGRVMNDSLASFLNSSSSLSGIDDFVFSCTLAQSDGEAENIAFAYTQNGYQVKINYAVSSQKETLALPTV
jgi:hypothetical protein